MEKQFQKFLRWLLLGGVLTLALSVLGIFIAISISEDNYKEISNVLILFLSIIYMGISFRKLIQVNAAEKKDNEKTQK